MNKLPKRSDPIYKEIESFEDYELTQCIAYEMAIRNNNNLELLNQYNNDDRIFENTGLHYSAQYYYFNKDEIEMKKLNGFNHPNNPFNSDEISLSIKGKNYSPSKVLGGKWIRFDKQDKSAIDGVNNIPIIKTSFSRPKLLFRTNHTFTLELNLAVPAEEILSLIAKIKKEYDNNHKNLKAPIEFLETELQKADNSKAQKKPKSHVYADWFYIYDYWKYQKKQNISDEEIFIDIELSNNDFNKKDNIRKIRDKMRYFIEDYGYKKIITGVENS